MVKKLAFGLIAVIFAGLVGLSWLAPAQAAPALQYTQFPTPTPGADGRILYLVQPGDTLYWISSVTGVSVDDLRQLNNLGVNDVLVAGQYILLGFGGPSEPTSAPISPFQTEQYPQLTPTPTQELQNGSICVLLFLDSNGDTIRQGEEIGMGDGEVSVTERLGTYSQKGTTELSIDPIKPLCFENITPGTYLVTMAIPEGYNRTTPLSSTIELFSGDTAFLNFGMQASGETLQESSQESQQGSNALVGILGITLVLGGVGAGVYGVLVNTGRFPAKN